MKRLFLFSALMIVASAAFSQLHYGVQVSANMSTADLQAVAMNRLSKSIKTLPGANLVGEFTFTKNISFRTSLGLLQKGVKFAGTSMVPDGADYSTSMATTLSYLEMPWNVVYSLNFGSSRLMLGAGPSFGIGLGGKAKVVTTEGSETSTEDVKAFEPDSKGGLGLKRFDASANALVGYGFRKGLYVTASYLYGLNNVAGSDGNYKNRGLQFSLGYMFK